MRYVRPCPRRTSVSILLSSLLVIRQVLSGIRLIKYFAWESFYAHSVGTLREREVRTIRRLAYVVMFPPRSKTQAVIFPLLMMPSLGPLGHC